MGIIAIMDGLQTFRIILGADKRGGGVRAVGWGGGKGCGRKFACIFGSCAWLH